MATFDRCIDGGASFVGPIGIQYASGLPPNTVTDRLAYTILCEIFQTVYNLPRLGINGLKS